MSQIFDCHLDLAWNALTWKRDLSLSLVEMNSVDASSGDEEFRGKATTCFPEMRRGKVTTCLATVMGRVTYGEAQIHGSSLDFSTHQQVYAFARSHLAYYEALERIESIRLIRTSGELRRHWDEWKQAEESSGRPPLGFIVSMEGADAMVTPEDAKHWFDLGLRCTGLVHYGTSAYAVGTGQDGPLTENGRLLLKEFESIGMILDVTHLSDTSFFEAIDAFSGPLIATHQACRSLVPHQRQFTDEQLRIVINRNGVVCVPCDAWMLTPGWIRGETQRDVVDIVALADHVDHICQLAGNCHHIGVGSDLDGGYGTEQTPTGLDSIADLQKLTGILESRGYSATEIDAIMGENALRFFLEHLPG